MNLSPSCPSLSFSSPWCHPLYCLILKVPDMTQGKQTAVKRQLIQRIRRLWRDGEPLNITAVKRRHPELIRTAYSLKPFLGWKGALDAAGVRYSKIKVELLHEVECRLCGEHLGALSYHLRCIHGCSVAEYRQDYPGAPVVDEHFRAERMRNSRTGRGGVRRLLFTHWEPLWTPEYVLDRIHELHRCGFDVNFKAIYYRDTVAEQAPRHFGSWDAALEAIGLQPDRIRLRHIWGFWTPKRILRGILARKKSGVPLSIARMREEPRNGVPLLSAAMLVFGSWQRAIEAAGLDYSTIRLSQPARYPTCRAVIKEIRRRRRAGLPVNISAVESGPHKDCALVGAAQRLLGGWRQAVEKAGIRYAAVSLAPWR